MTQPAHNTFTVLTWCSKCGQRTEHQVVDGKIADCTKCTARLDAARKWISGARTAEQMQLFTHGDK